MAYKYATREEAVAAWNTRAPSAPSAGVDEVARDAARYRHICASLMTDVDGMFSVEYRRDADTDECFFGKDELDEVVDNAIQSAAQEKTP